MTHLNRLHQVVDEEPCADRQPQRHPRTLGENVLPVHVVSDAKLSQIDQWLPFLPPVDALPVNEIQ